MRDCATMRTATLLGLLGFMSMPLPSAAVPAVPAGYLQFSAASYQVDEAAQAFQVTVTRSGGNQGAVSLTLSTSNVTAIGGFDYTPVSTKVSFAAGDTAPKTVAIPILNDTLTEGDQSLQLNLSPPTNGAVLGTPSAATLTILDDEPPPAAAVLSASATLKQLHLSWTGAAGATSYRLFYKPTNVVSTYFPVGALMPVSTTSMTIGVSVHRVDWQHGRYRLSACNPRGCTDSNEISLLDEMVDAIGYFKASNTAADNRFGQRVALSVDGNTLAVGAPDEDSDGENSGAVYVFARGASGVWSPQAYMKASNAEAGDNFGFAVTLSADGDTLAVGAPREDSSFTGTDGDADEQADNSNVDSGAVYVFARVAGEWSQEAYMKARNSDFRDAFGSSVALSGDATSLAVGAPSESGAGTGPYGDGLYDSNNAPRSGAVYIFLRASTWQANAYIKAPNNDPFDQFGGAIALDHDGNTLAVGAVFEASATANDKDDDTMGGAGAVYVFSRTDLPAAFVWSDQAYLKASHPDAEDFFGWALALSADGNTLAVGAPEEDSDATGVGGNAEVNALPSPGAAYVFARTGNQWLEEAYVKASNTDDFDVFGSAVALSANGNMLAVGAPSERSSAVGINGDQQDNTAVLWGGPIFRVHAAGAAYVFERGANTWSQRSYVKASNTGLDSFGTSVALNDDGSTLAVGAPLEASAATDVGGNQLDDSAEAAGAVYLY
jgi:hypothetical protein